MTMRLALALCLLLGVACPAAAASRDLVLETADGPRHAMIDAAGTGPRPTVLVLHGAFGTAARTARASGFAEAAERHDFTAVFPDGLERQWNDLRAGGRAAARGSGPDDIGFLRTLVQRLVADGVADPARVYIAGISNGGMMALTMACKEGNLFAGVGTVIASMPAGIGPCALHPGPVVMINGTADPLVPYQGGGVGFAGRRGRVLGVEGTADMFAVLDGCQAPVESPMPDTNKADHTTVTRIAWSDCRPGTSMVLYRVEGGGHSLPGRPSLSRQMLGNTNNDVDGAELILQAFAQQP